MSSIAAVKRFPDATDPVPPTDEGYDEYFILSPVSYLHNKITFRASFGFVLLLESNGIDAVKKGIPGLLKARIPHTFTYDDIEDESFRSFRLFLISLHLDPINFKGKRL